MRFTDAEIVVSPTDLANFLACRHKTTLDRLVAAGKLERPMWSDPLTDALRARGEDHERRYIERLRAERLIVVDVRDTEYDERVARTLEAMYRGADVIVQAALHADGWFGLADVLRKVPVPSALGAWSYEPHDTKLSRETRAGTIVQLCAYADLLADMQGRAPETFKVVTPLGVEAYRTTDFAAFYRQLKQAFLNFVRGSEPGGTYPEPVDHCGVCRWTSSCRARRRQDDHLSLVAGLGRVHQAELTSRCVTTLEALASVPVPLEFRPSRGSAPTYVKLREQARLQALQRSTGELHYELLPVEPGMGLTQLPEPRPGDLFLDLEGDPFGRPMSGGHAGETGREYLFGLGIVAADGTFRHTVRWAFSDADERAAFDDVMRDIMAALDADPSIHVYHYASYEPSAFKRLMGRYGVREADLDRLLRGRRFVDLYAIARQAIRAGVETYSIKSLEPYYGFEREEPLDDSSVARRTVELAIETGDLALIDDDVQSSVAGYNKDDCRSVHALRRWLESLRQSQVDAGVSIPRPPLERDEPSVKVTERKLAVESVRARLLMDVPVDADGRSPEQQSRYLLAHLLDWHDREDKSSWWEYYRLAELPDADLLDEPCAVAGLTFLGEVGVVKKSPVLRFAYPDQEIEIHVGDDLKVANGESWGKLHALDRSARTIDVLVGPTKRDVRPSSAFAHTHINPAAMQGSLMRLATAPLDGAAAKLLHRVPPKALAARCGKHESAADYAVRVVSALDRDVLAIQGPPGSGKTHTGARMICALVAAGKRVGVVATGHKVIRNLLDAVHAAAVAGGQHVRLGHKRDPEDDGSGSVVAHYGDNAEARHALADGEVDVLGGTAWLWAREEFAASVDVLFVDEAGQMSLANAMAVSPAAGSLVLLGDPQQLDQPQKGSHPDGVDVSALDHLLDGAATMPAGAGIFLPVTWRLAPSLCAFTSELFYEGRLSPRPELDRQVLIGTSRFDGAGLFCVDVQHDGCRSASDAEANVVANIVDELLRPGASWIDRSGARHALTPADVLVVAPYNAHVSRLQTRMPHVRAGTVDKFQGQEAPVVIYSMATSRPEDAPRGMDFLYSLNRLNVATSRARCACILVANPRLFQPDCAVTRHMCLANGLARFRELSRPPAACAAIASM